MDLFVAYDSCQASTKTKFEEEKKVKGLTTATLTNSLLTDAEYASGFLYNAQIAVKQSALDKLKADLATQT